MPMTQSATATAEQAVVFAELRKLLAPLAPPLLVRADTDDNFYLTTPYSEAYKKEVFFGAVQIKKRYVSYHLMPIYWQPSLLDGISDALRRRMQGKSCFNFTRVDPVLTAELADLTNRGFVAYRESGLV